MRLRFTLQTNSRQLAQAVSLRQPHGILKTCRRDPASTFQCLVTQGEGGIAGQGALARGSLRASRRNGSKSV